MWEKGWGALSGILEITCHSRRQRELLKPFAAALLRVTNCAESNDIYTERRYTGVTKRNAAGCAPLTALLLLLTGCSAVGGGLSGISVIYGAVTLLAALLLIGGCRLVGRSEVWFPVLFSCVTVVNAGYLFLSLSRTLPQALQANRVAYLGSVLLPLSMLMIILKACGLRRPKRLVAALLILAGVVFLVAASPGLLTIYYREVLMDTVHGATVLRKVYGPCHFFYAIYLAGYLLAMIAVIVYAIVRRKVESASHAVILIMAAAANLGVWLMEQFVKLDFEFLAVSYIISELFLLGAHLIAEENKRLRALTDGPPPAPVQAEEVPPAEPAVQECTEQLGQFRSGLSTLTPTERKIFEYYRSGCTTKEVMAALNIKENTLKFHNKNLYGKLGVSSRKQLVELASRMADK